MPLSASFSAVLNADRLRADAAAGQLEWLVANGIGGYASSTVWGINTRRYHGLLVAALHPPTSRAVLLSKLEETLELTDGPSSQSFALSANFYPGAVYPEGFRLLESWQSLPVPTWTWAARPDLRLEKRVWMAPGQNIVYVAYRLLTAPTDHSIRLTLVPLLAWRDYHSEMAACNTAPNAVWNDASASPDSRLCLDLPPIANVSASPTPLCLQVTGMDGVPWPTANFNEKPDWYHGFQHPRERERGQDYSEDLYTPGTLSANLAVGQTLVIVASARVSTSIQTPEAALNATLTMQDQSIAAVGTSDPFAQRLALAADAFVIQVPDKDLSDSGVEKGRTTVIAGYHWFCDWGRDTMIALPGLCLTTKRAVVARNILTTFAAYVDAGMLPNRFPDASETPEYNTVDATLWYFIAVHRYVETTNDPDLLKGLWPVLKQIVLRHTEGTRYNIHVDPNDRLLYAGQQGVQLTWMDAKVGDWVVTPRIGKPVEINALWVNALYIMADFARRLGDAAAADYAAQAQQTADSFLKRFPRADGYGLHDVLDTPGGFSDASIRPNQVFALSLPYGPVQPDSQAAKSILTAVQEHLYTPVGLRTLSPNDPAFRPRYEGDSRRRDGAYHQGTAWPWLLGAFVEAHYKVNKDRETALNLLRPLQAQMETYGIGSLAEIFDGAAPQRPNGCIAQAWSVAETLRVWVYIGDRL